MKVKNSLTAKEVAKLLGIPLVTVQRWIHQGKIPCKFKKNEYLFKRGEIEAWAKSHDFLIAPQEKAKPEVTEIAPATLARSIEQGGIFHDLEGHDIFTVLKNGLDRIDFPVDTDRALVLNELLNREEIASTGIGKGVAIPHPRSTLELNLSQPLIPLFFLDQEIDFNSVDGQPVFVLFFMFSPDTKIHLKLLSRLSFCLRDSDFLALLRQRATGKEIVAKVREIEEKFAPDK